MSQVGFAPSETTHRRADSLRVAVLSGQPLVRAGLSRLMAAEVADVSVAEELHVLGQVRSHDVIVYDAADGSETSIEALARLVAEGVPVVVLTSSGRPHLAETALAMGVAEVVPMSVDADGLVDALARAATGQTTSLEDHRRRRREAARAGTLLTDREASVLELIGAGMANREIAEHLFVSTNTLKTYIRTAYRKIEVSRRSQAVLWAARNGLIQSW